MARTLLRTERVDCQFIGSSLTSPFGCGILSVKLIGNQVGSLFFRAAGVGSTRRFLVFTTCPLTKEKHNSIIKQNSIIVARSGSCSRVGMGFLHFREV